MTSCRMKGNSGPGMLGVSLEDEFGTLKAAIVLAGGTSGLGESLLSVEF